jgi:hypothetical protein
LSILWPAVDLAADTVAPMEIRKSAAAMAALTLVILSGTATVAALAGLSLPRRQPSPPPATVKPLSVVIVNKKHVIPTPTTVPEPDAVTEPDSTETADTVAG